MTSEDTPSLSAEVRAVLDKLVPREQQTGDIDADLGAAARESMRRRAENSYNGGTIIAALRARGHSWHEVAQLTGIPTRTARRWAEPPE